MALTIQQIYETMIRIGRKNDPRSAKEIDTLLKEQKKTYEKLEKNKKAYFDQERLSNPYLDSRILYGDPTRTIKTLLACIDADKQEILLAHELRKMGKPVDLVISHHPEGRALIDLTKVMDIQDVINELLGVSPNIAEKLMAKRVAKLDRSLHPINHYQNIEVARLLDIPFLCCHTPADNSVHHFISKFVQKNTKQWRTVGDFMDALLTIPEFQQGERMGMGPTLFLGSPKSKLGKVGVTGMTGGTSGDEDIYEYLSHSGVSTLVAMHMSETHREKAEKFHLNVVVTGHMASDSIGLNLVLDHLEAKGMRIIPAGGFIRVKRKAS